MSDTGNNSAAEAGIAQVSVIGLGYIGLPTAAVFASSGLQVLGVDVSQHVVETVNAGGVHIEEGDLDTLVERCVSSGKLRAAMRPEASDAFIIAVPTPVGHDAAHAPDVSYVEAAGRSIAGVLKKGDLVILESTSPVGTTAMLARLLAELRTDLSFPHQVGESADINLAYCPERIIPGQMLRELVENDRIIGGMTPACTRRASALYCSFVKGTCHPADDKTAEMVKLTENAFRDVNIAFANELSMICDDLGIDVWGVINFANRHPRVSILNPGPGVGGHCIAVDPWFIVDSAPARARLIRTSREVNDSKPHYVIGKVDAALAGKAPAKIACLGLSYKPDVDDFRESPSLDIARALNARFPGRVVWCDPFIEALPKSIADECPKLTGSAAEAIEGADVVIMLVGHKAFRDVVRPDGVAVIDTVGYWR
ncbi:UDP-N-acetyl-D-mannosamine dehydrogenase [Pseudoxanthomonas mexicana]|uniref:UDP-N-acetyl-D-mannosamine dehydrogenase n=1 Tax=Pseudoxanthomonas mexicana TaxID=128785 RepID=UPI0028AA2FFD|nr:UDP-N-acetyl-D-mannosamine dehydrogenase [Pseudoxanthomonas mexicana]